MTSTADPLKQYTQIRDEVLSDPCQSFWLKDAIGQLENRDPCDAIDDVTLLQRLSRLRLECVMGRF